MQGRRGRPCRCTAAGCGPTPNGLEKEHGHLGPRDGVGRAVAASGASAGHAVVKEVLDEGIEDVVRRHVGEALADVERPGLRHTDVEDLLELGVPVLHRPRRRRGHRDLVAVAGVGHDDDRAGHVHIVRDAEVREIPRGVERVIERAVVLDRRFPDFIACAGRARPGRRGVRAAFHPDPVHSVAHVDRGGAVAADLVDEVGSVLADVDDPRRGRRGAAPGRARGDRPVVGRGVIERVCRPRRTREVRRGAREREIAGRVVDPGGRDVHRFAGLKDPVTRSRRDIERGETIDPIDAEASTPLRRATTP